MIVYILVDTYAKDDREYFDKKQEAIDRLDKILERSNIQSHSEEHLEVVDSTIPSKVRLESEYTIAAREIKLLEQADLLYIVQENSYSPSYNAVRLFASLATKTAVTDKGSDNFIIGIMNGIRIRKETANNA